MRNKFIFVFIILLITGKSNSQTDSVYSFILPQLKITQFEQGKPVVYKFENQHNRFVFDHSFLRADTGRYKYNVSVQDIVKVSIRNGTQFWNTAAIGGCLGFAIGFFLGGFAAFFPANDNHFNGGAAMVGGLVFGAPLGLAFGLIGLLAPNFDDYYIGKLSSEKRENYMLWLLKKNTFKP